MHALITAPHAMHVRWQGHFSVCVWKSLKFVCPLQADKRAHHNALERKRRDHIKDSFHGLRDSVPALQGEKVSECSMKQGLIGFKSPPATWWSSKTEILKSLCVYSLAPLTSLNKVLLHKPNTLWNLLRTFLPRVSASNVNYSWRMYSSIANSLWVHMVNFHSSV